MARRQGDFTVVVKKSRRIPGPTAASEKNWIAELVRTAETQPAKDKPVLLDTRALTEKAFARIDAHEPRVLVPIIPTTENPQTDNLAEQTGPSRRTKPKAKLVKQRAPMTQPEPEVAETTTLAPRSRARKQLRNKRRLDRTDLPRGQRWRARLPTTLWPDDLPDWKRLKLRRKARRWAK